MPAPTQGLEEIQKIIAISLAGRHYQVPEEHWMLWHRLEIRVWMRIS